MGPPLTLWATLHPAFHHPHCKKFLPHIQPKSALPSFKTILAQQALLK